MPTPDDQNQRAWLAHMRHELRTPLNAILGYSEMLGEDAQSAGDDDIAPDLAHINAAGRRLLSLVNDILDAAKIEAATSHDLNKFGAALHQELRFPIGEVLAACEVLLHRFDETQGDDERRAAYAPELEKIHSAAVKLLHLTEEIAHASSSGAAGELSDESSALRAEPMKAVMASLPSLETITATAVRSGHILVVDDNEANRDVLSKRLEREGYSVSVAEDGYRALDIVTQQSFDLVLLDLMMPGINGYQVLEQLKSNEALRHLPVIMISALDELESVVRCIEIGADDYLTKPFNPVLLQARIGASLEKKRLRDAEVKLHSDLEENFRKLLEMEALRDSLTHMMIHDLRTPLTSFMGGLRMVEGMGELNAVQQTSLEVAQRGGETLLGMINDLLDVSKMEAGALTLYRKPLDAFNMASIALQQVADLARSHKHTVIPEFPNDLPEFLGDEEKLQRTMVNLMGNAIKFTPRGGSIIVGAKVGDDEDVREIVFSVADNGPGIPPEAFERIFEKFGQAQDRSPGHKMSTGLGLTFCKMAIEAHKGRIWVESEQGKGTTFSFALPL